MQVNKKFNINKRQRCLIILYKKYNNSKQKNEKKENEKKADKKKENKKKIKKILYKYKFILYINIIL